MNGQQFQKAIKTAEFVQTAGIYAIFINIILLYRVVWVAFIVALVWYVTFEALLTRTIRIKSKYDLASSLFRFEAEHANDCVYPTGHGNSEIILNSQERELMQILREMTTDRDIFNGMCVFTGAEELYIINANIALAMRLIFTECCSPNVETPEGFRILL